MSSAPRDHGGGIDAAISIFGGARSDWIDLSTGINPVSYPFSDIPTPVWHDLPDSKAMQGLFAAARAFWDAPKETEIVAASGVSQIIAAIPLLSAAGKVSIMKPTYNEHEAAFKAQNWTVSGSGSAAVFVHPNNPDGRLFTPEDLPLDTADLIIIDESFCDTCPDQSLIAMANQENVIVLKGLGKFWGLGGLRLGFAIGMPNLIEKLKDLLGPWPVSGPAIQIGTEALSDRDWAESMLRSLDENTVKLDHLMTDTNASVIGGTSLYRLYSVKSAKDFQSHLAKHHIWSRVFPYSQTWVRLGLPSHPHDWARLEKVLGELS